MKADWTPAQTVSKHGRPRAPTSKYIPGIREPPATVPTVRMEAIESISEKIGPLGSPGPERWAKIEVVDRASPAANRHPL